MEDIISVVDGRPEIVEEVGRCDGKVRKYLKSVFEQYLRLDPFREAVPGYLPSDPASQERLPILFERFKGMSTL